MPHTQAVNFRPYISSSEGINITLTTKIISDFPTLFKGSVKWKVVSGIEHNLPPTSRIDNYHIGDEVYSNLSLYNLSYYDDSGNYTCTACNKCGNSSVFVYIHVTIGMSLLLW